MLWCVVLLSVVRCCVVVWCVRCVVWGVEVFCGVVCCGVCVVLCCVVVCCVVWSLTSSAAKLSG